MFEQFETFPLSHSSAFTSAKAYQPEKLEKLGITSNLVRFSVGLEDVNDLIKDLDNALNLSQA